MKSNLLIISLLTILFGCSKGDETAPLPDSKPIELETLVVEVANAEQVILTGRLLHLNNEEILEHGFVVESSYYGQTTEMTYLSDKKLAPGKVTFEITDGSIKNIEGTTYKYRFYIKTATKTYQGTKVPIVISNLKYTYLSNLQAAIGETISVAGDFKGLTSEYSLYAGWDYSMEVPFEVKDNGNAIVFSMPVGFTHGQEIAFNLRENNTQDGTSTATLASVKVLGKLNPPTDYNFYYSDMLRLSGPGAPRGNTEGFSLIIGDDIIPYFYEISIVDLLYAASGTEFQLGYTNGRDTHIFPEKLKIRKPAVDQFNFWHRVVHPGGTTPGARLEFNLFGPGEVSLGGKTALLTNYWTGTDEVTVGLVEEGEYPLVVSGPILNYTSQSKIKVQKLKATAINPKQGYYGDEFAVSGNFISGNTYNLYINGQLTNSFRADDGQLRFVMPNLPTGNNSISLGYETVMNGTVVVKTELGVNALPGTFDDFYPKSGPPGTVITLKGKGMGSGRIFFADQAIFAYDYSPGEVKVAIPFSVSKGKKRVSVLYESGWVTAPDLFEVQ